MKKVLISRHNGIGDIIMTIPFVLGLSSNEYDVTYETIEENFGFIKYLIPNLKLKLLSVPSVYTDCRAVEDGYDILVNLNRLMEGNNLAFRYQDVEGLALNQQILTAIIFTLHGLPTPFELSPSAYIHKEKHPTNKILIFTNSTNSNRSVSKRILGELEKVCNNRQIFLNPKYESLIVLAEEINNAKFVMSVDTGPLHLAEALSTKWFGLYTNMSGITRVKYYKYGEFIQSKAECAPCNYHAKNCRCSIELPFECTDGFDVNFLVNKIGENI